MAPRLTDKDRQLRAITEAEFQDQVVGVARSLGWDFIYHPFYSERSTPGWPDLVIVSRRRRRTVYAELKTETGPFTKEQPEVLSLLADAGNEVYVWRPRHTDELVRVLTARQRPNPSPETAWRSETATGRPRHATGLSPASPTMRTRTKPIRAQSRQAS